MFGFLPLLCGVASSIHSDNPYGHFLDMLFQSQRTVPNLVESEAIGTNYIHLFGVNPDTLNGLQHVFCSINIPKSDVSLFKNIRFVNILKNDGDHLFHLPMLEENDKRHPERIYFLEFGSNEKLGMEMETCAQAFANILDAEHPVDFKYTYNIALKATPK